MLWVRVLYFIKVLVGERTESEQECVRIEDKVMPFSGTAFISISSLETGALPMLGMSLSIPHSEPSADRLPPKARRSWKVGGVSSCSR